MHVIYYYQNVLFFLYCRRKLRNYYCCSVASRFRCNMPYICCEITVEQQLQRGQRQAVGCFCCEAKKKHARSLFPRSQFHFSASAVIDSNSVFLFLTISSPLADLSAHPVPTYTLLSLSLVPQHLNHTNAERMFFPSLQRHPPPLLPPIPILSLRKHASYIRKPSPSPAPAPSRS